RLADVTDCPDGYIGSGGADPGYALAAGSLKNLLEVSGVQVTAGICQGKSRIIAWNTDYHRGKTVFNGLAYQRHLVNSGAQNHNLVFHGASCFFAFRVSRITY